MWIDLSDPKYSEKCISTNETQHTRCAVYTYFGEYDCFIIIMIKVSALKIRSWGAD